MDTTNCSKPLKGPVWLYKSYCFDSASQYVCPLPGLIPVRINSRQISKTIQSVNYHGTHVENHVKFIHIKSATSKSPPHAP